MVSVVIITSKEGADNRIVDLELCLIFQRYNWSELIFQRGKYLSALKIECAHGEKVS